MKPTETVIVIRSLVPGGVAQQDGRLIPGDRLLFVNETVLENASLDLAVSTLKCAPKGKVVIGVAKPLPLPESNVQCIQSPIESQVSDSTFVTRGQASEASADYREWGLQTLEASSSSTILSLYKSESF